MSALTVNTSASKKELCNEAITFSKYGDDPEAMTYLNEVLSELKFRMNTGEYTVFHEEVQKLIRESNK